jgi:hypothetical protein
MLVIRTADAGRGAAWLLEGFEYFKNAAATRLGIVIILMVILFLSALLPLAGVVLQIITPVLIGGLMVGCREAANGGQLSLNHLFSQNTGNLVLLGVLYSIGTVLIIAAMVILMFLAVGGMVVMSAIVDGQTSLVIDHLLALLLVLLVGLLLYLPLLMGFWFGPALIMLEGQSAINAMRYSFIGCIKNVIPFLVYGLVGLVLSVLATITFMLGWLILMPMTIAGLYIAYRDIYTNESDRLITQP